MVETSGNAWAIEDASPTDVETMKKVKKHHHHHSSARKKLAGPPIDPSLEDMATLGDAHIQKLVGKAKTKVKGYRAELETEMRRARTVAWGENDGEAAFNDALFFQCIDACQRVKDGPRFVGTKANELSKWLNAESMTRWAAEKNREYPTLRQVLRIDDHISMEQMTRNQACALPDEGLSKRKKAARKEGLRSSIRYRHGGSIVTPSEGGSA